MTVTRLDAVCSFEEKLDDVLKVRETGSRFPQRLYLLSYGRVYLLSLCLLSNSTLVIHHFATDVRISPCCLFASIPFGEKSAFLPNLTVFYLNQRDL